MAIIVARGTRAKRVIDGRRDWSTPVVALDVTGAHPYLRAGIIDELREHRELFGPFAPPRLLQCWRAMLMLNEMPVIDSRKTLAACWYVASPELTNHDTEHVLHLEEIVGRRPLGHLYDQILSQIPTTEQLHAMLTVLAVGRAPFDVNELAEEVTPDTLARLRTQHPVIFSNVLLGAQQAIEVQLTAPLMASESVARLFTDLHIDQLVSGPLAGDRQPWQVVTLDELDTVIRHCSLVLRQPFLLAHTTQGTGELKVPSVTTSAGDTYEFIEVFYREGRFLITVVRKHSWGRHTAAQYTLSQLRRLIGVPLLES